MSLRLLRYGGLLLALAWLAFGLHYAFDPRPMFAPYGDTGGDIFSTGMIAASIHSLRDLFSAAGWQQWQDYSAAVYLSMGPFFIAEPLQWIVRNPFSTVKLVYVLQFSIAFAGTALLYSAAFGRTAWRWMAAAIYATIPLTALQTRLMAFGWVVALMPIALVGGLWLVRRFGSRSAAAVGVLCSAATCGFTIEYAIFAGLPLLALSLALSRWKGARIGAAYAAIALAAFVLLPAYTVIVTIFGHRLMDWITLDQAVASQLGLFSQGVNDQLAGILREATISPDPSFNASAHLGYAEFAGAIAWALALAALALCIVRRGWRRWWPVVAVGAVCLVLSFGPSVPLVGAPLWSLFGHLPVLRALRTPDRFEQINALLVALGAAYGGRLLAERNRAAGVVALFLGIAVIAGYAVFDINEHVLALQNVDEHLPAFNTVARTVDGIGGRTAVIGFPVQGSEYDWAPYAPDAPRLAPAWDLAGRYGKGDAGVAILRRAAVRSIVTTPNWTRDSEAGLPPDMADLVARSAFVKPLGPFAGGVNVFAVEARPMVASVHPLCTYGGPAAFEIAAGLRTFDDDAFVHESETRCAQTLYADYDPRDQTVSKDSIAGWSGTQAFGKSEALPPPNVFEVDRFGIAAPWYRNEYRGDSLLDSGPFLTYGYNVSTPLTFAVAKSAAYAMYVRVSGLATLQTRGGSGRLVSAASRRSEGFTWVRLPLGTLQPGTHERQVELVDAPESSTPAVVDVVDVAPDTKPAMQPVRYTLMSDRVFEPPIGVRQYAYLFPRPQTGPTSATGQNVVLAPGTHVGFIGGEARITASGRDGEARFHWSGATGTYVVVLAGWLNAQAPSMTVSTAGQTFTTRYDPSIGISPSVGYARLRLTHGAAIDVHLRALPGGTAALTQITTMPVQAEETPTGYDGSGESWQFGGTDPMQFYEAIHADGAAVASGTIRAFAGAVAELPFDPVFVRGAVTAAVQVSGGKGLAELRCGARVDRSTLGSGTENPGGVALAVERNAGVPCALRVVWDSETLAIKSIGIHATGSTLVGWNASQYFAAGRYRWSSSSRNVVLVADGRPWPSGVARQLSAGTHVLTLRLAPAGMAPLLFVRAGMPAIAPPAPIHVTARSATSWNARTSARTTLELAQFDDGNWFARTNESTTFGYPCDLINTCFPINGAEGVFLSRRLAPLLALGLSLSVLDVVVAVVLLFVPEIRSALGRRKRPSEAAA